MKARILIVDDHEIVRQGICTLLQRSRPDWEICGEAANGNDAVDAARTLKPDVVILDITMPGMSGFEATSQMRRLDLHSPILIFTMHSSERLGKEIREAGAQGYVLKSQAARDLVVAIDTLLGGGTFFGSQSEHSTREHEGPNLGIIFRTRLATA